MTTVNDSLAITGSGTNSIASQIDWDDSLAITGSGSSSMTTQSDLHASLAHTGTSVCSVTLGVTLATLQISGSGVSSMSDTHRTILGIVGAAANSLTHQVDVGGLLEVEGSATNSMQAIFEDSIAITGAGVCSVPYARAIQYLYNTGSGTSSASASTTAAEALVVTGEGVCSLVMGSSGILAIVGAGVCSMIASYDGSLANSGSGTTSMSGSGTIQGSLAITGEGVNSLTAQTIWHAAIEIEGDGYTTVLFKDPSKIAWVMNTETTAMSWYENYHFESLVQTPDGIFAVAADGLYEITGEDDSGDDIDAEVGRGMTDFGSKQIKRVDAFYVGYNSDGVLTLTVGTPESGHSPTTYYMDARSASEPRNTRVVPGKGRYGRYWQVSVKNYAGADFEVYDSTALIAESKRRV